MDAIYLTPASISFLNQCLLSVLMTGYLCLRVFVWKAQKASKLVLLLIALSASFSVLSLLMFLENSLLPSGRLLAVYLENTILGIVLLCLIDFSYQFPFQEPRQKIERSLAITVTVLYTCAEIGLAVWRYSQYFAGQVEFRPDYMDYLPAAIISWVIVVIVRSAFRHRENLAARRFALIFLIPFVVIVLNILRSYYYVSDEFYLIVSSVGILFTLSFFALTYLSSQPEATSYAAKFSSVIVTICLAVFGSIAWLVAPVHAEGFAPALVDHRTMFFSPNAEGGYTVTEAPFIFEEDFGDILPLTDAAVERRMMRVDFNFPFFGNSYTSVFVGNDSVLSMGTEIDVKNYQLGFTSAPVIMPLLIDLDPEVPADGRVYARLADERLIVTYDHVQSFEHHEEVYTFQVILYSDGRFSITYNGLPTSYQFEPNEIPLGNVWALGIKPGDSKFSNGSYYSLPLEIGAEGMIEDFYLAFRSHQYRIMAPITVAIVASILILLVGVPLIIQKSLAQPLNVLLRGVESMNNGNLKQSLPVQYNDEIGYLTSSFNTLGSELHSLVHELEDRVANRTSDLLAVNEQLRKLSVAVEQSPSVIVITDVNANIEYVNPAFTRSTGYTFEEVKGMNPRFLKSFLTPPETYRSMWHDLTNGHEWRGDLVNKKKNGDVYWEYSVIAPIYGESGSPTHYVAIKEDITAWRLTEQALRDSEEQYRQLFELESDAIFIVSNEDGRILKSNPAASSLYGYTRQEFIQIKNTDLAMDTEATQKIIHNQTPAGQVITIPLQYHRKKDGCRFPVEITARSITWKNLPAHIVAIRDITDRKKIEEELVKLSVTDPLTEVANRRYFYIQADQYQKMHMDVPLAILMLDIDYFKRFNDTFGHACGDSVLRQLANRLNQHLRPGDILARFGGEEFIILLPRVVEEEAAAIAKRLWESVESEPFQFQNNPVSVTVSIGVATWSRLITNIDDLIRNADEAMYQAKQAGRNQWVVWRRSESETSVENLN